MSLISFSKSLPDPRMVRANSTCFDGKVALRVGRKLIGENEQAVQRRAQLVRHVGEKLRLVTRGKRELLRLAFERLARLFDFAILAFDFLVLLEELSRFFFQLLVGLLQFFLPALQLGRERLRLLEQIFRARVRFDRVQDDADAFRQLIEKRLVGGIELFERGKFHDRFDLAFEEDRQDDDVHRLRFAQAGADLDIIRRHIRQKNAFLFQGGLADQSFAET